MTDVTINNLREYQLTSVVKKERKSRIERRINGATRNHEDQMVNSNKIFFFPRTDKIGCYI